VIAVVQSNAGHNAGGLNPPQFAAPPTAGNLLVVLRTSNTDAPANGWSDVFGAFLDLGAGGNGFRLWQRTAVLGDPAIPPGVWAVGSDWIIAEVSGLLNHVALAVASVARHAADNHPTLPIAPVYPGEVIVLAGIIHANTLVGPDFTADAPFAWIHKRDVTGGVPNVVGLQSLIDPINDGAYAPGASTGAFVGAWALGAVAYAGGTAGANRHPRRFW
jgi:hypothetical protein